MNHNKLINITITEKTKDGTGREVYRTYRLGNLALMDDCELGAEIRDLITNFEASEVPF